MSDKNGSRTLLGVIVGASVVVATLVTLSMGQPADITNDPTGTVESSPRASGPVNSVDDDRSAADDIACFTPTDEGSPENLAGCNFDPHKRYDYVDGAWVAVPDDYVFANGNRPPTGAELTATQNGE